MRNDVNKRPKRPGDLAAILAAPGPPDHAWYQGVVDSIDLANGQASVLLAGGVLQNYVVIIGDTAAVRANMPVMVLKLNARYFIVGPILTTTSVQRPMELLQTLQVTATGPFLKASYPTGRRVHVRVQAGGGAGGGCPLTAAGQLSTGSGGGAGGHAESWLDFSSLAVSETITVGAGGTGAAGAGGNAGGSSSFGALVVATGGSGGQVTAAGNSLVLTIAGPGGVGTAGQLQMAGQAGHQSARLGGNSGNGFSGAGGASVLGGGGQGTQNGNGGAGGNYGGGGGGTVNNPSQVVRTGGAGGPGIVLLEIYG